MIGFGPCDVSAATWRCSSLPPCRVRTISRSISIDVEGGQSTLFVTPAGQSVLIDTGWAGFNGRDADRIAATAKEAGVTQIDYLLITHFHRIMSAAFRRSPRTADPELRRSWGDGRAHSRRPEAVRRLPQGSGERKPHRGEAGRQAAGEGLEWTIVSAAGRRARQAAARRGETQCGLRDFQKRRSHERR